jgi:propionyl-CoA carboxylase alpha chain
MSVRRYTVSVAGRTLQVELGGDGEATQVVLNGETFAAELSAADAHGIRRLHLGDRVHEVLVDVFGGRCRIAVDGVELDVLVEDERAARLASFGGGSVSPTGPEVIGAPMPGLVVSVNVEAGQEVSAGETLAVLQAMKMENEISSPRDGTVKVVHARAGQTVEQGQPLVELEVERAG